MAPRRRLFATSVAVSALLGACGSDDSGPVRQASNGSAVIGGDIVVFAAASLTEAYTDIGAAFEAAHPDADVTLNFGSSSDLVAQIVEGAPADVYASADESTMARLVESGGTGGEPRPFATNSLQMIVEPGNPMHVATLEDLADPDVLFVTCAPEVPIGRYSEQVLQAAGVTVTPVSLEESVKGIVTKVTLGEADAGIVYRTDVLAAGGKAEGVDIPADVNVTARYPIVVTNDAADSAGAQAFVEFVLSDAGQQVLRGFGFAAP